MLGTDPVMNAVHGSASPAAAAVEIPLLFPGMPAVDPEVVVPPELAAMEKTLALFKPDAVEAGRAEEMLQHVRMAGFAIIARRELRVRTPAVLLCLQQVVVLAQRLEASCASNLTHGSRQGHGGITCARLLLQQ
jgi:hypothetical protein